MRKKAKLVLCAIGVFTAHFAAATVGISSSILDRAKIFQSFDKAGQLGVGVQGGVQSGLNLQYWTAESRAVDLSLTGEHKNLALGLSHLWMFRGAFPGDITPLTPYVGAGLLAIVGHNDDILARTTGSNVAGAITIPLGFEFLVRRWGFFGEAAPAYEFAPVARDFLLADVGARYYF